MGPVQEPRGNAGRGAPSENRRGVWRPDRAARIAPADAEAAAGWRAVNHSTGSGLIGLAWTDP